ncbi:MAG: MATE family efflux transporter [Fluviibacter sp.]|jgi:MATE family multidrug resistance protein
MAGTTARLYRLAWPVLVAQLATISMMAIDTIVVGHAGTDNLAALAVGASIYVSLALALSGVVQAILPGMAHRLGKNDPAGAAHIIRQAFWLVLLLACIGDLLLLFPGWMIAFAELPPPVAALTVDYLHVLAFSLPASLGYRAFHAIAGGVGRTRPLMWLSLSQTSGHALLAPLLADTVTLGGVTLGLGLGAVGAAGSQAVLAWLICLVGVGVLWRSPYYRQLLGKSGLWPGRPDWAQQRYLLRLGVPMGMSYFVEISAFTLMAIFIARLGPEVLSGHRIVANISAMLYMFPLAMGTATAALVGQADGAQDWRETVRVVQRGFAMAAAGSVLLAGLLWVFRVPLAALGSPDPEVIRVAVGLIAYVAGYQLFDALQTIAGFALRGYHVTFVPLGVHLASFWLFGLGGGYWLAFEGLEILGVAPMGAAGFWCAALIATLVAAIGLVSLLLWVQRARRQNSL